jgi:hypothetical protein
VPFGGRDVRIVRHAATAVVNAHTGRVTAIPDVSLDPVAASWVRTFPRLFAVDASLDPDLTRRLPPPIDALLIQARAFAQVGVRGEFLPPSHLPKRSGGDTLFTLERTPPYVDAATGELAVAFPILDATDRLRGLVTADGGASYEPHWRPLPAAGPRWSYVLERMQRVPDTLAARQPRDTHPLHGAVRVIPADGGPVFAQTRYGVRADGAVQLQSVSVLIGDSVGVGVSIPSAVGAPSPPPTFEPLTPEEFRARVEERYGEMRDALRRGDLRAFGEAYEALGRLLRTPTR